MDTASPTSKPIPNDGSPDMNSSSNGSSSSSSSSSSSILHQDLIEEEGSTSGMAQTSVLRHEVDDDDEEDVCRICRNSGDADNPLRYPCACSGSIKFVHQDCLLQWLNHSNTRQCEVCKYAFSFSPVYAENAPARLPFQEFVAGMTLKAFRILQFILRLSFVLTVWLLFIPFLTFWIWRLAFVRSFAEARGLFLSHMSASVVLTDCLHGFLLSASIVFIFLGATSLRDYFRHLRELGGHEVEREAGGGNAAHGGREAPEQVERRFGDEGDAGDDGGGGQGIAGVGQLIRRNAENVAARWEMQAARLDPRVDHVDGLDDADGAEDVPFDELVGMQGPVFHLLENAFTVLASNIIFLCAVILVPFSFGRALLYYASWMYSSKTGFAMPLSGTVSFLSNITLNGHDAVLDDRHCSQLLQVNDSRLNDIPNNACAGLPTGLLEGGREGPSQFSDVATLAAGYVFISFCMVNYVFSYALYRYAKGEPLPVRGLYGIASLVETIPSLFRQFLAAMSHLMTMVKVAFLLVIELGVFPLMCGWWLDVCTVKMFGKSMAQRVHFFSVSPLASTLIHWVIGIVYMLQISIFVSLLRGVLRNGVLYFLRDPADPNYNPFRDLIDDPVHKHARRVLLSVAVYGSLIVLLVFLPVKFATWMVPSIFPLDISVSDPFTEIPADMLLFQICIPFAIENFKLRTTIKSVLHYWFTAVGWALGLTDFLLPRPGDHGDQMNINAGPGGQDILHRGMLGRRVQAEEVLLADRDPPIPNRNIAADAHSYATEHDDDGDDDDEQFDSDSNFAFRIVLLLVMAWLTLLFFNSSLIVIPVSIGRALFNAIPLLPITHGIKCNDLYAFIIGSYVIWMIVAAIRYVMEHVRSKRVAILFNQVRKWGSIFVKSCVLLSIWILVIPLLIGLLFELLVVVPMRVPVDESPVFILYQDWALGLIFLKIWTRLVMLDQVMMPLMDASWRVKFERVREDGFSRLQGLWVLREIVCPIVTNLLTALCVPYVLAKGFFPLLGYPLVVNSAVYRFAWLGSLGLASVCFCTKRFHLWFTNLHNSIRDDRYLIGRRLHDYREEQARRTASTPLD